MSHIFKRPPVPAAVVTAPAPVLANPALARVVDNPSHARFDLWVGDELIGILGYRGGGESTEFTGGRGEVVALMHTVVKEEYGGRGWAAVLVGDVLALSRERGWRLQPVCTYVQRYLGAHPEELDLIVDEDFSPTPNSP
ncbi:putative GNAT family acetyltransferase [Rhodococcus sp. PvR044]